MVDDKAEIVTTMVQDENLCQEPHVSSLLSSKVTEETTERKASSVLEPIDTNVTAEVMVDKGGVVTVANRNRGLNSSKPPMIPPPGAAITANDSSGTQSDTDVNIRSRLSKNKYKPISSSGYGRANVSSIPQMKKVSSGGSLNGNDSWSSFFSGTNSSDNDNCIVGSVSSVGGERRRRKTNSQRRQRIPPQHRRSHSAPSSPTGPTEGRVSNSLSSGQRSSSRLNARPGGTPGGSSWAQQQREKQRLRQETIKQHAQVKRQPGRNTSSSKNPPLKRTIPILTQSNSDRASTNGSIDLRNGTVAESHINKSLKSSADSSPSSTASSQFRYDGSNITNDNCTDENGEKQKQIQDPKTPTISSFRRTANGLIASLRSPKLKVAENESANSNRGGSATSASSSSSPWKKAAPLSSGRKVNHTPASLKTPKPAREDPLATCETATLAEATFAKGTGISDEEIRKILNSKVGAAKQWELKKKVEASAASIKNLKETLNLLLKKKNGFCVSAAENETAARKGWAKALHKVEKLEEDRISARKYLKHLEVDSNVLKTNIKDAHRELSQKEGKVTDLEAQLAPLKEALTALEKNYTEAKLELAAADGRVAEATKQAESWRSEIASVEAAKSEAVKQAETAITSSMERACADLRDENAYLRTKMQARDEELGRLVDLGDDNDDNESVSQLTCIKKELDRLREKAKEAESLLALQTSELERAIVDKDDAISRCTVKDRDMSELMKSIGDIQRSAQTRDEEAQRERRSAEAKAEEIGSLLTQARGEMSVLMHERYSLKENLESAKNEQTEADELIKNQKIENQDLKTELASHSATLQVEKELRARAEQKEQEERRERIALSAQMVAMTKEHARVEAQLKEANESNERSWRDKYEAQKDGFFELEKKFLEATETITGLDAEKSSLKEALNNKQTMADARTVEDNGRLNGEINVLKERLAEGDRRALVVGQSSAEKEKTLCEQVRILESERRRMHNVIQELRGNVRVFARVRPFLPGDGVDSDAEPAVVPKSETELNIASGESVPGYKFSFDRVFPPSIGQEAIFEEVSEFVQSALDGYNVCLFSYGQTGSGKTHTMQGSGNGQMRGIVPRAIEQVGRYKQALELDGWRYEMKVSFLEIYNETIRDLLREEKNTELKHEIKVARDGTRFVTDLTLKLLEPTDQAAVEDVMRQAAKHRSVASTDMNSVSSRSHSVFTLHLSAVHTEQRQTLKGSLNLVDLAGSERLERSGATGDRAKEAVAINKSLSSLTDVFVSIGKKSGHIPFRNSKLTYLLQPSLSGDGKTLMMANLSPTEDSYNESLCSLRFAAQVNKCELGKPKRAISEVSSSEDSSVESTSKGGSRTPRKKHQAAGRNAQGRNVRRKA